MQNDNDEYRIDLRHGSTETPYRGRKYVGNRDCKLSPTFRHDSYVAYCLCYQILGPITNIRVNLLENISQTMREKMGNLYASGLLHLYWGNRVIALVQINQPWKMWAWIHTTWWRHQMETFSVLLAICAGNSPVPGEFPTQRPVALNFDVYFDLHPNKRLSKQSWCWWFETPSRPLWRHRNDIEQHSTTWHNKTKHDKPFACFMG